MLYPSTKHSDNGWIYVQRSTPIDYLFVERNRLSAQYGYIKNRSISNFLIWCLSGTLVATFQACLKQMLQFAIQNQALDKSIESLGKLHWH